MSDLIAFFTEFLFWFWVIFITVGAVGGWVLAVGLLARERVLKHEAELAALDAASHPIVGRREAA